ncbi:DUF1963 domain-containing protein [Novosphingobium sp. BW1]|uniref:DUF1963 domain-containing protein n=1 Tax=Novosphingobium sp. BW1 TaxID=2592621 RepID=UPI0011DE7211|nr:DUF1963 domain-containing protein [Novosphingobium sp. BW1]TYC91873.1 DUF1963 domain-containing protein [Novosphingobium sp. BW1]
MKRMIAAFVLMGLAIAVAIYIAMAPVASPTADGPLNSFLTGLDGLVDGIEAAVGRSTGALIAIGIGLALSLVLALIPTRTHYEEEGEPFFSPSDDLDLDHYPQAPGAQDLIEDEQDDDEPVEAPAPAPRPEPAAGTAHEAQPAPVPAKPVLAEPTLAPFTASPLTLVRKAREPGRDWFGDSSWFGGLPRLGDTPWPRDLSGIALPFLAQIDLADIAACSPEGSLPSTGSLAVFLGDGGVVPLAADVTADFTDPPQDLPPAFEEGAAMPFPQRTSRLTRWLFPYWPIEVHAGNAIGTAFERDHPFYAVGVGEPVETLWWHSVQHFADRLREGLEQADAPIAAHRANLLQAREELKRIENHPDTDPYELEDAREDIEGLEADLARIEEQRGSLPDMLAALESFTEGRALWSVLSEQELEIVRDLLPEAHERYGELIGQTIPGSLGEMATVSLRAAISGPPEAVAAIPETMLSRLNTEYRLPAEGTHRLFVPADDSDEIVLADLAWDDMIEWCWPEEARFQIRIAPEDAAQGNWERARALFVPS